MAYCCPSVTVVTSIVVCVAFTPGAAGASCGYFGVVASVSLDISDAAASAVAAMRVTILYVVSGVSPVKVSSVCQLSPPSMLYSCPAFVSTVIVTGVFPVTVGAAGVLC